MEGDKKGEKTSKVKYLMVKSCNNHFFLEQDIKESVLATIIMKLKESSESSCNFTVECRVSFTWSPGHYYSIYFQLHFSNKIKT